MAMAHHEKLAKRQTFWEFYKCSCRSAAHLKKTLVFSWWHHFFWKKKPCLLFVWGPSAAFLSRWLFSKRKWEGCLYRMSRNSSHPLFFSLFSPLIHRPLSPHGLHSSFDCFFSSCPLFSTVWQLPIKWAIGGQCTMAAHLHRYTPHDTECMACEMFFPCCMLQNKPKPTSRRFWCQKTNKDHKQAHLDVVKCSKYLQND